MTPLSILVIDDDPVMRELLEALLGLSGHSVYTVVSGEDGLERLRTISPAPDVVLTDMHMPGIHGATLAAALLESRAPATLLLGMSGSFPTETEKNLLDAFLQKPFTVAQFEAAVANVRSLRGEDSPGAPPAAFGEPVVLDSAISEQFRKTLTQEQMHGLYDMTLQDAAERLQQMRTALAGDDLTTLRQQAHALKGVTGMVGATELHKRAAAIELSPRPSADDLDEFAQACERLHRKLETLSPRS